MAWTCRGRDDASTPRRSVPQLHSEVLTYFFSCTCRVNNHPINQPSQLPADDDLSHYPADKQWSNQNVPEGITFPNLPNMALLLFVVTN